MGSAASSGDAISKGELLRQVHPNWCNDGQLSREAFNPSQEQCRKLSVDNGNTVTAEASYLHHENKLETIGVVSVTAGEAEAEGLRVVHDPERCWKHHMFVDFNVLGSRSERRKAADALTFTAQQRGWAYNPHGMAEL